MTKSISISGAEPAMHAAVWCRDNILNGWDIKILSQDMFSGNYIFEFTDPTEASYFALKWI